MKKWSEFPGETAKHPVFAIIFIMGGNVFSHKNAIIKNTLKKTSYLPKLGYRTF
jgi:hypothetical protein